MTDVFEWPRGYASPKEGGYRFETPRKTIGKQTYHAVFFAKTWTRAEIESARLFKDGYAVILHRGNVFTSSYHSLTKKTTKVKDTYWIVYARKVSGRK